MGSSHYIRTLSCNACGHAEQGCLFGKGPWDCPECGKPTLRSTLTDEDVFANAQGEQRSTRQG